MDFVIIGDHPPNLCPSSNAMVRKQMAEGFPQLPMLAKKLGAEIFFIGIPMVDHKIFMILKAPSYEIARQFLVESRILQTNTAHIYPTVSFEEATKMSENIPPTF
jgi:hypothetical protein